MTHELLHKSTLKHSTNPNLIILQLKE